MGFQSKDSAEASMLKTGWLSRQPDWFQREVLSNTSLEEFDADEVVYRIGGPPGGIYGLVAGTLKVSTAPAHLAPRFIVLGIKGHWAGEGPYLTGEPRIASVLHRTESLTASTIPISQEQLGQIANASRKQVNAALARFAEQEWIKRSYRSIEVLDSKALLAFSQRGRP